MIKYYFLSIFMLISYILKAQSTDSLDAKAPCKQILMQLEPSYKEITTEGNPYSLYAIKYSNDWIFVVIDSTGIYSLTKPSKKEFAPNSNFMDEGICKIIQTNHYLKRERRMEVEDVVLSCYYEFKKKGAKAYKMLCKLENKSASPQNLAEIAKSGKDKLKDAQKQVKNVNKEITQVKTEKRQIESTIKSAEKGVKDLKKIGK